MQIMSSVKLSAQIRSIKGNSEKLRTQVHEALVSCAYYAFKDGNTNPFNGLLAAVQGTARVKGITMWAELLGCVLVKNEAFVLNKTMRKESAVTCEEDFAPFLLEIENAPRWYEIVGKESVTSIFNPATYLDSVYKKLVKEGQTTLAEEIKKASEAALLKTALENLKNEDALM